MAIKRKDFQKVSSNVQEFLLKLPDEEASARLRDNLLQALHFLQLYYRVLQNRDKDNDLLQWNIDHSLSPLTPFREAPDKFEWEWINVDSQRVRQSLPRGTADNFKMLPSIIVAVRDGDITSVKQILKEDINSLSQCDCFSRDSITYAIEFENLEILKFLLKAGGNVNNVASDGSLSLHRAVYKGNDLMVRLLLEYGAHVDAQDSYNRSPIHWSVVNKSINCLKVLIEYNTNVNIKDRDGMSAAMWACYLDRIDHFRILNKYIKRENHQLDTDNDGKTFLHWSVRKKEPLECLTALINEESCLIRDKDGKTCLHLAAEQGALEACKLIIEIAGLNMLNEKDNKKQTPLHLATLNGHAKAIKLLIDYGADPYTKDTAGASPIDYVTKRNLFFCNSIIEICLKQSEKKIRKGAESTTSSFSQNNDLNITPAPPTTPKSSFSRNFQHTSPINTPTQSSKVPFFKENYQRPPRPLSRNSKRKQSGLNDDTEYIDASQSEIFSNLKNNGIDKTSNFKIRSTANKTGWMAVSDKHEDINVSMDRIPSASLRLSRTSSRSSFASEDLEKYMNNNKPIPPPRVVISSNRKLSGRSQDSVNYLSYDSIPQPPPPIKPRKSSLASNSFRNQETEQDRNDSTKNFTTNYDISNNINIEDVSGDDSISVTSTKGEGCASDFSDIELKQTRKQKNPKNLLQDNKKRPSTPMDIRTDQYQFNHQTSIKNKSLSNENAANIPNSASNRGLKYQHIGEQQIPYRFNEWEPYNKNSNENRQLHYLNERQKSPSKSHQKLHPNSESSPRQTSGRGLNNQSQNNTDRAQNEALNVNIELVVSGKNIVRKENSPNTTPREVGVLRPPTRRLQPIDRNSENTPAGSENEILSVSSPKQQRKNEILKSKNVKANTILERKRLEPIKTSSLSPNTALNPFDHDNEVLSTSNQALEEDISISENTLSSEKPQLLNSIRVVKNKIQNQQSHNYNGNKKRLIEPLVNNDID